MLKSNSTSSLAAASLHRHAPGRRKSSLEVPTGFEGMQQDEEQCSQRERHYQLVLLEAREQEATWRQEEMNLRREEMAQRSSFNSSVSSETWSRL